MLRLFVPDKLYHKQNMYVTPSIQKAIIVHQLAFFCNSRKDDVCVNFWWALFFLLNLINLSSINYIP